MLPSNEERIEALERAVEKLEIVIREILKQLPRYE